MSKSRSEFKGTIIAVRAVEDSIRATKKYTEGVGTMRKKHPIQGEEFPSKMFCKYYEVYPEIDLDQILPFLDAVYATSDWLWGETPCIDVLFNYDYRSNTASVIVQDGVKAVKELERAIPKFKEALAEVRANGDGASSLGIAVIGTAPRERIAKVRSGDTPYPEYTPRRPGIRLG